MSPSPIPESALTALCPEVFAAKGAGRYLNDCVIRRLRTMSHAEVLATVGTGVIQAGIGTLVITETGMTFTPAPTVSSMIAGLAKAGIAAVGDVLETGSAVVSDEVAQHRLNVCRECPLYDAEAARCRSCGCFTTAKAKLKSSRCPENHW